MTFGEKIQFLRKKAGLSQEELAEKLDITRQTVSKWELDQSTPELIYIAKLSDIYQVSTDYLIKEDAADPDGKPSDVPKNDAPEKQKNEKASTSPLIALSLVLSFLGSIGILLFIVLSCVNPWEFTNETGTYKGLMGYLLGSGTTGFFVLSVILLAAGIAILTMLSIRTVWSKKERRISR